MPRLEVVLQETKWRCIAASKGVLCQPRQKGRGQGLCGGKIGWHIEWGNKQHDSGTWSWIRWVFGNHGWGIGYHWADEEAMWIWQKSHFSHGKEQPKIELQCQGTST